MWDNFIQLEESQCQFRVPVLFCVVDTFRNVVVTTVAWSANHRISLQCAVNMAKGMNDPGENENRYKVVRASAEITIGDEVCFSD